MRTSHTDLEGGVNLRWQERVLTRVADPADDEQAARALGIGSRVVDAAYDLLLDSGGPSFTVSELAKRAQTSLATLYSYFSGKDEVLLAVLERISGRGVRLGRSELDAETDPLARLQLAVTRPIRGVAGSGGRTSLILFREARRLAEIYPEVVRTLIDPATVALANEIDRAVTAGVAVSDDTFRDATNIGLFVWALIQATQASLATDFDHVADDAWDFCSRALSVRQPARA